MNLNLSNCNIDLGSETIKSAKAALKAATSGIADLIDTVSNAVLDKVNSVTDLNSFAAEFLNLDLDDIAAVAAFKERWGSVVNGLDAIFDDVLNFDICSFTDVKAEEDAEGNLTKVPQAKPSLEPGDVPAAVADSGVNGTDTRAEFVNATSANLNISKVAGDISYALWLDAVNLLTDEFKYSDEIDTLALELEAIKTKYGNDYNEFVVKAPHEKKGRGYTLSTGAKSAQSEIRAYERSLWRYTAPRSYLEFMLTQIKSLVAGNPLAYYEQTVDFPINELDKLIIELIVPVSSLLGSVRHNIVMSSADYNAHKAIVENIRNRVKSDIWDAGLANELARAEIGNGRLL